jgi:hypothetical protein
MLQFLGGAMSQKLPSWRWLCLLLPVLSACSFNQLTVRASQPLIEGGMQALYREPDVQLARDSFAPNIELLEGMLVNDPGNVKLQEYAAQAYYGYAFGFVEDSDPARAANFYRRGMQHGLRALYLDGLDAASLDAPPDVFNKAIQKLDIKAVPALFWTASNWAKWIDLNRDKIEIISQLPRPVAMIQRVLDLDEAYFNAGPDVFMGVYYGSRPPMLGGDFAQSEHYFDKARTLTGHKILMIDVMQARYLEVQRNDRERYHALLTHVLNAPNDLNPDQALANALAKQKAATLLKQEDQWF